MKQEMALGLLIMSVGWGIISGSVGEAVLVFGTMFTFLVGWNAGLDYLNGENG